MTQRLHGPPECVVLPAACTSLLGMTDPPGGYGWRSGRALGGTYSLGKVAERAEPIELRPLGLLLLPEPLERFALRAHAEDLLAGPGVLAVEPPRLGASGRVPAGVADGLSAGAARGGEAPRGPPGPAGVRP